MSPAPDCYYYNIVYYFKLKKEYSRLRREFDYHNRGFSIRVENRAREMFRVWTSQELYQKFVQKEERPF